MPGLLGSVKKGGEKQDGLAQQGEREGKGTGKQMVVHVSLSHNHAHHDSMCTDRRTRVGGEEATAKRSKKKGHTGTSDGE